MKQDTKHVSGSERI